MKPPVGNKCVWEDSEFIVMLVGGPNRRMDYHVNCGEEFFYQIEGDIKLKFIDNGKPAEIEIKEGDMFLLPPRTPHSPQRPRETIGLVIERKRLPGELDSFEWYCPNCSNKVYEESFQLKDIASQIPPIFEQFYTSQQKSTCRKCGTRVKEPPGEL